MGIVSFKVVMFQLNYCLLCREVFGLENCLKSQNVLEVKDAGYLFVRNMNFS